ncbi:MAG: alpha/beta hydrolase [Chloroflexi bacterium]|nr:alpha/beta hydrolase [Chloroflexota bacterium]
MKRFPLPILLLGMLSLACSLAGGLPAPAPTSPPTSRPYMALPTQARPTYVPQVPTLTSTPTLIVPTVFPTFEVQEESAYINPTATQLPASLLDVTYCSLGGVELKMDAHFPADAGQPAPAVVYVHGGGWSAGSRRDMEAATQTPALLQAGFAVFTIDYRLAPRHMFPAMIQDVKCAIRSIRAHAVDYNIDPGQIGAWGGSAGGHLVALLGTSDENAGFDVGEYLEYSSRVQAVVDLYGPADLTLTALTPAQEELLTNAFTPDQYELASPVTYVTTDDPPFLILHGEKDSLVPLEQSAILYSRLTSANIPATLVIVLNAGHGFNPVGGQPDPTPEDITQIIVRFFVRYLK